MNNKFTGRSLTPRAYVFLLLYAAVLLTGSALPAQSWQFSFQAGINVPGFGKNNCCLRSTGEYGKRVPTYQFSITRELSSYISLSTGVLWDERGAYGRTFAQEPDSMFLSTLRVDINYSYLTFPLLFEYGIGGKFRVFANAGGYYAHKIKSGFEVEKETVFVLSLLSPETAPPQDVGLTGGGGFEWGITKSWRLRLEANLFHGLSRIGSVQPFERNSRHQGFRLLMGLSYRLPERSRKE